MTEQDQTPIRPRRWLRRLVLWCVMSLAVLSVLVLALGVWLLDREVKAPRWLQDRVEAAAGDILSGGSITFGQIYLILGKDYHLRVRLQDTVLLDAEDRQIARIPGINTLFSPRGLLFEQELLVQEVDLLGPELSLRRLVNGEFAVAFDAAATPVQQAETLPELIEQIESALDIAALEALERISATGMIVNYADARAGRNWSMDGGALELALTRNDIAITGTLDILSGRPFVTGIEVAYRGNRQGLSAAMSATVTNAVAEELATQSAALSWLTVLDGPLNGQITGRVNEAGILAEVAADLDIRDGMIRPDDTARPIPVKHAALQVRYDPAGSVLTFDSLEVESGWGSLQGNAQAFLRFDQAASALPQSFEIQLSLDEVAFNPDNLWQDERILTGAGADLRLRLDPFDLDIGQFHLGLDGETVTGKGDIGIGADGWNVAVDVTAAKIEGRRLFDLWPAEYKPRTLQWFRDNITTGTLRDLVLGLRVSGNEPLFIGGGFAFEDLTLRAMPTLPPIQDGHGFASLDGAEFFLELEGGTVDAPQGGRIDLAGSTMHIPQLGGRFPLTDFVFRTDSTLTATLSLLDLPPFEFISKANQSVTMADGLATAETRVSFPMMPRVPAETIDWSFDAELRGVRSQTLVPDKELSATRLTIAGDAGGLRINGQANLDGVAGQILWQQPFDGTNSAELTARVRMTPEGLANMGVAVPPGAIRGEAEGVLTVVFEPDTVPRMTLTSDLVGASIAIPEIGWSKPLSQAADFALVGRLDQTLIVDRIRLSAPGLTAEGRVEVDGNGAFSVARLSDVQVGRWFAGDVELTSRGAGRVPALTVNSGTLDLRNANITGAGGGNGGPVDLSLDQLILTDGITLDAFSGAFDMSGGISGDFSARLNGTAPIVGRIDQFNGAPGLTVSSLDASAVLSATGLLGEAEGETLFLNLRPTGAEGEYDGTIRATGLRLRNAPAMAALLDAVSVVGLLQQLSGQGLLFNEVEAEFRITPDQLIIARSNAVGPGLGISLDGTYTLATKAMDFQGVLSPFYLLNGVGAILTRKGEGLIGFNYTLGGTSDAVRVGVNPLSALTPGMFREIFRRPPPDLSTSTEVQQ